MAPSTSPLLAAFDEHVVAFRTRTFVLAEDLEWLYQLRQVGDPVAVILRSARILEVLALRALGQARLASRGYHGEPPRVYDALKRLADYDRINRPSYLLFDGLRVLGNRARHAVLSQISPDDAEQGYALALHAVNWYFGRFREGPKHPIRCDFTQPTSGLLPPEVTRLLAMLDAGTLPEHGFLQLLHLGRPGCTLLTSAVPPAVLAERLLDGGRTEEAQAVLTEALLRFGDDVRLQQLQGLLWSRAGELGRACVWLEKIEPTESEADEETLGILAGAYKRLAAEDAGRRTELLRRSHEGYERGWQLSKRTNGYLGVNAAATALWLKRPGYEETARRVRALLEERRRLLLTAGGRLSCWDVLTLAEACLLLKDWEAAREGYREAMERFPEKPKAMEVARAQGEANVGALGGGEGAFPDGFG